MPSAGGNEIYSCLRRQRRSDDPGVVQYTLPFATLTAEAGSNLSCCHCLVGVISIILTVLFNEVFNEVFNFFQLT